MASAATTAERPFRVLSLDGGGAKGFYSLGVLREVEAMLGNVLVQSFDLIFGTSTGAIIAALLAQGRSVEEIHGLYREHVPRVMQRKTPEEKSAALANLATEVFGNATFTDVHTRLGIVATNWALEWPFIFKSDPAQAHGRSATFVPGYGVLLGDAVQASCSAYPFFSRKTVHVCTGADVELVDGGYCANNPTLYAIADATSALGHAANNLRVLSVGVGNYPEPTQGFFSLMRWAKRLQSVQLLQKTLEINTRSMEQLRAVLFADVPTVRISDTFEQPEMATDLFESDMSKLGLLRQRGSDSFAARETELRNLLLG